MQDDGPQPIQVLLHSRQLRGVPNADCRYVADRICQLGKLAWALATVLVAAFATSSISSAVGTAMQAVSNVARGATSGATQAAANRSPVSIDYFLDTLFRRDQPDTSASPQDAKAEAGRILARSIANGNLDPTDRTYLARLIAPRTGISQQDAEERIVCDAGKSRVRRSSGSAPKISPCPGRGG